MLDTPAEPDGLAQRQARDLRRPDTADERAPRGRRSTLPKGPSDLLIRDPGGGRSAAQATLVTTFVAGQPVSFTGDEASLSARLIP